jgi:hypothetical protein
MLLFRSNRSKSRLGAFGLAALAMPLGMLVTATPAAAATGAATGIPCPPDIGSLSATPAPDAPAPGTAHPDGIILVPKRVVRFTVVSATPTFFVGDSRIVINNLDSPVTATFTALQSTTVTVSVMIGDQAKLTERLQQTVNATITQSRMTSVGVNTTATVPPHSSVLGQYGMQGYTVVYDAQTILWYWWTNPYLCFDDGTQRGTTSAPTPIEGWQLSPV